MCTLTRTSVESTCLYTQTQTDTLTHTDACTHPGVPWRLVRSRIGSSASCELDSPGSVLIPATLFTSPHIHTHTHSLQSRPQPSRGLYQVCLFVCSCLSPLSFCSSFLVSIRPHLSLCCDHRSQRPW